LAERVAHRECGNAGVVRRRDCCIRWPSTSPEGIENLLWSGLHATAAGCRLGGTFCLRTDHAATTLDCADQCFWIVAARAVSHQLPLRTAAGRKQKLRLARAEPIRWLRARGCARVARREGSCRFATFGVQFDAAGHRSSEVTLGFAETWFVVSAGLRVNRSTSASSQQRSTGGP
jgi:hypothetical protein